MPSSACLGVVGHTHVGAQVAGAGGGRFQAGEDLHEGGLAGAVGADERHMLAAVELEVDVTVDVLVAVGLGYALRSTTMSPERGGSGNLKSMCLWPSGRMTSSF